MWSTVNVHVSAFRCFYQDVLEGKQDRFSLPPRGRGHIRLWVLDRESAGRILEAHTNLKQRALLEMTDGSGLRVSEVCRLRPCHIESAPDRMLVRVEQTSLTQTCVPQGGNGAALPPPPPIRPVDARPTTWKNINKLVILFLMRGSFSSLHKSVLLYSPHEGQNAIG